MEHGGRPAVATFFVAESLVAGARAALGAEEVQHARIRRLDPGSAVRLVDGAGHVGVGMLVRLTRSHATVEVASVLAVPQPAAVHLLAPVADRDRMLWLAEKATELGITSWRPILWHRSRSVAPRGEGGAFRARARARMVGALKQSGGAWLPDMHPDAPLERAVQAVPVGSRLLLDVEGVPILSRAIAAPVTVVVGPEGGIEDGERAALLAAEFTPVRLTESVLRFETAGAVGLGIVRAVMCGRVEAQRA